MKEIKSNIRVLLVFFILCLLFDSCISTSGMKSSANNHLDFVKIEGHEFLIQKEQFTEINDCISTNNEIRERILHLKGKEFNKNGLNEKENQFKRKVIKRKYLDKAIPRYHLNTNTSYEFFLCVKNSGEVSMIKLVESNKPFKNNDLKKLLSTLYGYQFEPEINSTCLECVKYDINIEAG